MRAQVTRYLLRPKPFVLDFINERAESVGLLREVRAVVGLHVRHGDKAYDMYQVAALCKCIHLSGLNCMRSQNCKVEDMA